VIFGFLPEVVRSFVAPAVQWMIYGALMIIIVFLLPRGIVPAIEQYFSSRKRTDRPADAAVLAKPGSPEQ